MTTRFIYTIILATILCSLAGAFLVFQYAGLSHAYLFFAGAAWGCLNLYLIKRLVEILLSNDSKSYIKTSLLVLIKFPLLYGAGYFLLKSDEEAVIAFVSGLTLFFAMVVILGIGRSLRERA